MRRVYGVYTVYVYGVCTAYKYGVHTQYMCAIFKPYMRRPVVFKIRKDYVWKRRGLKTPRARNSSFGNHIFGRGIVLILPREHKSRSGILIIGKGMAWIFPAHFFPPREIKYLARLRSHFLPRTRFDISYFHIWHGDV